MSDLHRIGRRAFLHDLGRTSFAVVLFGGVVAACSSDDDASTNATSMNTRRSSTSRSIRGWDAKHPPAGIGVLENAIGGSSS